MSGRFAALIAVLGARCRSDINAITGVHRRGTARLRNLQARHLRRGRVPTRNETDVKGFRARRVVVEAIRFLRCGRAWIVVVCVALEKDDCVPRLNVAWSCSHAPLDLSVLLKRARQHSRRALFRRQFGQRGLTKTPEVGDEQWCHIAVPLQESCAAPPGQ